MQLGRGEYDKDGAYLGRSNSTSIYLNYMRILRRPMYPHNGVLKKGPSTTNTFFNKK